MPYVVGVIYQDSPYDDPYTPCPSCGELVFLDKMARHLMKDHDDQVAAVAIANHIPYLKVVELIAG
jgi:hypothetical protein